MKNNNLLSSLKKSYQHVYYYFMRLPVITRSLVIALISVYVLGLFLNLSFFILKGFGLGFNPIQLLSYAFVEHDFIYLIFNVLVIWMFGYSIEEYWGTKKFGVFVLVCILGTAISHLLLGSTYATGISGLFFSLLLAYAMMWPNKEIQLLIPPIPIKAKYLLMIYAAIVFIRMVTSSNNYLMQLAYLGGPLCGYLLIQYWRKKPPFNSSKKRNKAKTNLYRIK